MSTPTISQLQQALAIAERIEKLQAELARIVKDGSASVASSRTSTRSTGRGRRKMSAATIAKMRAAQQARWAKKKVVATATTVVKSTARVAKKAKRKLSPEGRAKIVAALKARWAKAKAAAS